VPPEIDTTKPSVARVYDYFLGGKDNFAADREAAKQILRAFPESREAVHYNREFLGATVRYLAGEAGIRQFIDIGTGLPTQNNVHEVAQSVAPDARVIYVDNDPVVCVHGRALLANAPSVAMVEADLHEPKKLRDAVAATRLADPDEPAAVLLFAVLHFMKDPYDAVAKLRAWLPPGSYMVISHLARSEERARDTDALTDVYSSANTSVVARTIEEIESFFGDFEILDLDKFVPPSRSRKFTFLGWGGVARKPG
jgi:hypothetical protein